MAADKCPYCALIGEFCPAHPRRPDALAMRVPAPLALPYDKLVSDVLCWAATERIVRRKVAEFVTINEERWVELLRIDGLDRDQEALDRCDTARVAYRTELRARYQTAAAGHEIAAAQRTVAQEALLAAAWTFAAAVDQELPK